jgi:hypothetical protein
MASSRLAKLAAAAALTAVWLWQWAPPVLVLIPPDVGLLRPHCYPVTNPLRDRAPERAADAFLDRLRRGDFAGLPDESYRSLEARYHIQSWRLGDRRDSAEGSLLVYWVTRLSRSGHGEPVEEEVSLAMDRSGKPLQFTAIY